MVKIFPNPGSSETKIVSRSSFEENKKNCHKNVYPSELALGDKLGHVVKSKLNQKSAISVDTNEELKKLSEE